MAPIASESQPIVFVIDDDKSMREALKSLLLSVGLRVEQFDTASEFLKSKLPSMLSDSFLAKPNRNTADAPSCLVIEIRLPGMSGLDFQVELAKANVHIPIIFIARHGDIPMSVRAMKAGAVDFLTKPFQDQHLLESVFLALDRDRVRREHDRVVYDITVRFEALTRREQEVMGFMATGLTSKQIAAKLWISESTVKLHRQSVMRKMGARSLPELVGMANMGLRLVARGSPPPSGTTAIVPPPEQPPLSASVAIAREADEVPVSIASVLSPVDFTVSRGRPIRAKPSADVQPVFKTPVDHRDHKLRLHLCRTAAADLLKMIEKQRFNVRDGYRQGLWDYIRYLPPSIRNRNLLFADQEARILRDLFAADADGLSPEFAARLRAVLHAHMALRVFYPGLERFYDDVRFGRTNDPLPIDAVDGITTIVAAANEIFDRSVRQALSDAAPSLPTRSADVPREHDPTELQPPPDPLGTLPTEKARAYARAGVINRLWTVFQKGEALNKNSDGWIKIGSQLVPHVRQIIEWLSSFVPPPT